MKKTLLYLFAFICIQYFVSWAVFAVWLLAAGHTTADVLAVFNGKHTELITPSMQILSSALYCILTLALFIWRKWAVLSPAYLRSSKWDIFFWSGLARSARCCLRCGLTVLCPTWPIRQKKPYISS